MIKVKSLCLIKHHAMKTSREWRYSSTILDLGTAWREVSVQLHVLAVTPQARSFLYPRPL
jgi:hypothetical protein